MAAKSTSPATSPRHSRKNNGAEDTAQRAQGGRVELKRQNTHGEPHPGKPRAPSNALSTLDHRISYRMFRTYEDYVGTTLPLMLLEFSGHGVPYIIVPIALFIFWDSATPLHYVLLVNFFIGIITDLLWSVLLKPTCRRVRPYWAGQKQLGTVETVDQYSFPSGHSTRAVFVACFAHYVYTLGLISENMALAVVVWAGCICVSRVLLGRHHVGDVVAGVVVGYVNYELVRYLSVGEQDVLALRAEILTLIAPLLAGAKGIVEPAEEQKAEL